MPKASGNTAATSASPVAHRADVEAAAARLLDVVDRGDADVLTIYDWHGGYGHPDHIKVHDVGLAAARQRPALRVLEATFNRDAMAEMMASAAEDGVVVNDDGERMDPHGPADDGNPMGTPTSTSETQNQPRSARITR